MKTLDRNIANIKKPGKFLCVFMCCLMFAISLFNSAVFAAKDVADLKDDSFWSTATSPASSTIGEFYATMYELIMYVAGGYAYKANYFLGKDALTFLALGFCMWLFFEVGKTFASVTGASFGALAYSVLFRGIVVMIIATFLNFNADSSNVPFAKQFGDPIITTSYRIASHYLDAGVQNLTDFNYSTCLDKVRTYYDANPHEMNPTAPTVGTPAGTANADFYIDGNREAYLDKMKYTDPNMFTAELVMYGGCVLRQIAHTISAIGLIGSALIIESFSILVINMDFLGFIAGCMIVTSAVILLCIVPINLLDSIIKITIVAAVMPILLILWAFPVTRKYSNRALIMYIHGGIHVIMICIMLGFCLSVMTSFATQTGALNAVDTNMSLSEVRDTFGNMATAGFTGLLVMPWLTILLIERSEGFTDFLLQVRVEGMDASASAVAKASRSVQVRGGAAAPKVTGNVVKWTSNRMKR